MSKNKIVDTFKKGFHSLAVTTLLLPNLMGVGIVAAEEQPAEAAQAEDIGVTQETSITPENMVYENGTLTLHNQVPGTNIAAVLPNGSLIYATVPFHGRWSPRQSLARNKIYVGDELEFFTYDGTTLGESIYLTVEGEGETRPADQQAIQYSRQHFGYIPTERDTSITYRTEPFFNVEMTFPNGAVETKRAGVLGQVRFDFAENNYTTGPGHVFSVRVFDRNNNLIDLRDPNVFTDPSRNQIEIAIPGDPIPESHTVTIDPNGGTINEDYRMTEVNEGETYSVPLRSTAGLVNPGYTLVGYTVTAGTLLDQAGNPVTEIPTYTTSNYTPQSDVTLSALWEETTGGFRVLLYDAVPSAQTDKYTVKLVAADGTETPLSSNSYGADHRTWTVDDVPNGTYTLVVDGYQISDAEKFGQPDTTSNFIVNEDGTATVDLEFVDNKSTTFIRYRVYGEEMVATYPLGIEVRDLNDRRTSDIGVTVTDDDGTVFEGTFDEYNLWTSNEGLLEGTYTITLTTPEGTVAEINPTVASQVAQPTEEANVFTVDVNEVNQGNLTRVFGAFRLVEIEEEEPEEPEKPKKSHPVFDTHPSETKGNPHGADKPGKGRPANPGVSNVPEHARNNRGF